MSAEQLGLLDPSVLDAKTANILYHDWEAKSYDEKWSISFDERCIEYAREKFLKVAPEKRYDKVLEIGCGTGFFIVNLWQAGLVGEAHATDISQGMVDVCVRNGHHVGVDVHGRASDAESLPYPDDTFDLVVGHAVLHHLPDVPGAIAEAFRVLKPGGLFVVAGEPTRLGFAIVGVAKRTTAAAVKTLGRILPGTWLTAESGAHSDPEAALEAHVDLHEFHPHMVRGWLRDAGFYPVNVQTEEFVSGVFGWSVRTLEALAAPERLGVRWALFAYRNYLRLYRIDNAITRRIVPSQLFYNVLFSATKPE
ncbi:MAG: class I SAM-dependent methyltransferase [Actinomycetota bacterium]|nr:class I SAM-dependent methyltransferase [Actinomycetota bacterium]